MTKKLGLAAAAIIVMTACGGGKDVCDRAAASADECGYTYSDADLDACKASLDGCSKDEQKALDEYWDCLDAAGFNDCPAETTTTTSTDMDDFDALLQCALGVTTVSGECLNALGGGSTTTTTTTTSSR